jgi:hypothetical protein
MDGGQFIKLTSPPSLSRLSRKYGSLHLLAGIAVPFICFYFEQKWKQPSEKQQTLIVDFSTFAL